MFSQCSSLTSLDLSSFDTSKVTNMGNMFYSCKNLKYLDIRNFTFSGVSSYGNMFSSVPADCEIIVKDDGARSWILTRRSDFTNVKTVTEVG
jgi:surface protein